MSEQIKVEFFRHDNFVCGRVLEMPERLRGKLLVTNGKYHVNSNIFPALSWYQLFIRGEKCECDNDWFEYAYPNAEAANEAVENFQRLIKKWNEGNRPILDEKEKEYLTAVIKPFRDGVKGFVVERFSYGEELVMAYGGENYMYFPPFAEGTMYKGMERGKKYTVEELGL